MLRRVAAACIGVIAACGGGDDAFVPSDPAPDLDDSAAWVRVSEAPLSDGSGGSTYITGHLITDPPLWPYEVSPVEGACLIATRQTGECRPYCEWNQACIGGTCISPPIVRAAGVMTIEGGDATWTLPFDDGSYQLFDASIVWTPGTPVTTSATGDVIAAFSATAVEPKPIAITGVEDLHLRVGAPLVLRWEPSDPGSRVRITLGADQGHAFFRSLVIECDAPDEHGGITVPQAMVDRLADPANWACGDCYSHEVRRYRRARTSAGNVPIDLWVQQLASFYLVPES